MRTRYSAVVLIVLGLLSPACGAQIQRGTLPTATTMPGTATFLATPTHPLSATAPPQLTTPQATTTAVPPIDGMTSTQVNVRTEPSTGAPVLGIIPANMRVEIVGKDPGESWWQINYPHEQATDGKGWVTAQYVVAAKPEQVPVIGGDAEGPGGGPVAVIQQQLNVRSGPGTGFDSLGTLNPQDVVRLTGKDANGAWLQIDFPSGAGPDSKGWVNAAFVQAQGVETLPIITEAGEVVGTGTPTTIPPTPTATVVPARDDDDSPDNPVVRVLFEAAGTHTLIYNGDLSTPQGDAEDWVAFVPYTAHVLLTLDCRGNGSASVGVMQGVSPLNTSIRCGGTTRLAVTPGENYLLHLQATSGTGNLQYVSYVLTVETSP